MTSRRKRAALALAGVALVAASWPAFFWALDALFFQGSGHPPPHLRVSGLFPPAPAAPGTHAILFSGAICPRKNHRRYWNNISLMFCTLEARGYRQIVVLEGDGTSPTPDRVTRSFLGLQATEGLEDSPSDLDGDGRADVSGPGTLAALAAAIERVGAEMKGSDRLFLFLTDHGQLRRDGLGFRAILLTWGGQMWGRDLNRLLEAHIPPTSWVAVLGCQCHSARFLSEMRRPRTLIMGVGWPLWIWSDQDYSVFPYRFCEALLSRNPSTGATVPGDPNGDGRVSLREAFDLAAGRDWSPEWPRLWILGPKQDLPASF